MIFKVKRKKIQSISERRKLITHFHSQLVNYLFPATNRFYFMSTVLIDLVRFVEVLIVFS